MIEERGGKDIFDFGIALGFGIVVSTEAIVTEM